MICKHCGKEIDDNARFCLYCGTLTTKNEVKTATTQNEVKTAAIKKEVLPLQNDVNKNTTFNQQNFNSSNFPQATKKPVNPFCLSGFIIAMLSSACIFSEMFSLFLSGFARGIGIAPSLLGLILSIVGLVQLNKNKQSNQKYNFELSQGFAISGIVLNSILVIISILFILFLLFAVFLFFVFGFLFPGGL